MITQHTTGQFLLGIIAALDINFIRLKLNWLVKIVGINCVAEVITEPWLDQEIWIEL